MKSIYEELIEERQKVLSNVDENTYSEFEKETLEIDHTALELYKQRLITTRKRHISGQSTPETTLIDIANIFYDFCDFMNYQANTDIDATFIKELFSNTQISSTADTFERDYRIGALRYGLWLYGATGNQANNALCKWLGFKSATSIKNALKLFETHANLVDTDSRYKYHDFCCNHYASVLELVASQTSPFPKEYTKAHKAYEELIPELKDRLIGNAAEFW